ncbi:MAG: methyltransferase domain-containing protein [Rhodospirillales bacterium]|nr:MAG: methyltransferase domain-containing protein [Rhodospirillales bacterium]
MIMESRKGLLKDFAAVDVADGEDLIGRLDQMQALAFFKRYKQQTFALMGAGPGRHLADIGCGAGDDARLLAGLVGPEGRVTGFDVSTTMIEQARERHSDPGVQLSFVQAPADRLPVDDDSFDGVRTDRLYVHLSDPAAALREAVRTVKPGGRVVVSEPDMASFWTISGLPDIAWKVKRGVAESVNNAPAARNLYYLFRDAGLENVGVSVQTLAVADPTPAEGILNIFGIVDSLVAGGRMTDSEAAAWRAEWEQLKAAGRFFGGLSFFIVAGQKPL